MSKSNGFHIRYVFFLLLVSTTSLIHGVSCLEERSCSRPDPLRQFKAYNGGFNVTNKHYLASAAFTGVHGYAIAGIWILSGVVFGIFLIVKAINRSPPPIFNHSNLYYFIMFMLVVFFTILALVSSSLAIAATRSSFKRTTNLKESIVEVSENARTTIKKVGRTLKEVQNLLLPYDPATSQRLNSTNRQLSSGSKSIRRFVRENEHSIDLAIHTLCIVHLAIVSINLVLLVTALVLLLLHWHPGFIIIIFICWILTTLYWVLTGVDFFLYIFAKDACSAFEYFNRNPQNNSLSSMIRCMDPSYSDKIISETGFTVHNFISESNYKILQLYNMLASEQDNFYESGVFTICNPFTGTPNYSYIFEKCPDNTIPIGDLPNVLATFTCYDDNSTTTCASNGKFLSETYYKMASSYSRSIQSLIDIFPDLQNLARCTFVKEAVFDIVTHQCKPLKASFLWLWSSMLSLSIFMVVLVSFFIAKAYQDRGKCFSVCSIFPNGTDRV